jgi:hypothetical protein
MKLIHHLMMTFFGTLGTGFRSNLQQCLLGRIDASRVVWGNQVPTPRRPGMVMMFFFPSANELCSSATKD